MWHERLFMADKRIKGHEVDFARVNSGVLTDLRVGFNPYIIGMHLFEFIEELASKGKLSHGFQLIKDSELRKHFDQKLGPDFGKRALFEARRNLNDSLLVNFLSDDDFQDFVNKYNLFIAGFRPSQKKWGFAEVYIKSRSGKEYRKMLNKSLYHPPYVMIREDKARDGELYLDHVFEGRTLVTKYVPAVLIGLAYLWDNRVKLETTEFEVEQRDLWTMPRNSEAKLKYRKFRVLYACEDKKVDREVLSEDKAEEADDE